MRDSATKRRETADFEVPDALSPSGRRMVLAGRHGTIMRPLEQRLHRRQAQEGHLHFAAVVAISLCVLITSNGGDAGPRTPWRPPPWTSRPRPRPRPEDKRSTLRWTASIASASGGGIEGARAAGTRYYFPWVVLPQRSLTAESGPGHPPPPPPPPKAGQWSPTFSSFSNFGKRGGRNPPG